jgi:hypothetical protein
MRNAERTVRSSAEVGDVTACAAALGRSIGHDGERLDVNGVLRVRFQFRYECAFRIVGPDVDDLPPAS